MTISSMNGADLSRSGTWLCTVLLNTSVNLRMLVNRAKIGGSFVTLPDTV